MKDEKRLRDILDAIKAIDSYSVSSYGVTGGSSTHTHTTFPRSITLGDSGSYQTSTVTGSTRKSGGSRSSREPLPHHGGWNHRGWKQPAALPGYAVRRDRFGTDMGRPTAS